MIRIGIGIGEIGNVITGRAACLLSEAGFESDLAPPMLIVGHGSMINTASGRTLASNAMTLSIWREISRPSLKR